MLGLVKLQVTLIVLGVGDPATYELIEDEVRSYLETMLNNDCQTMAVLMPRTKHSSRA